MSEWEEVCEAFAAKALGEMSAGRLADLNRKCGSCLLAAEGKVAAISAAEREFEFAVQRAKARVQKAEPDLVILRDNVLQIRRAISERLSTFDRLLRRHRWFRELKEAEQQLAEYERELQSLWPKRGELLIPGERDAAHARLTAVKFSKQQLEAALGAATQKVQLRFKAKEERARQESERKNLKKSYLKKQAIKRAERVERSKAYVEYQKKELHRLRAIAAREADKSRERAAELRNGLKKQLHELSKCPYCCGKLIDPHLDHIIPISKGGLSTVENLVFVCEKCNSSKSDLTLSTFLKRERFDRDAVERRLETLGKVF